MMSFIDEYNKRIKLLEADAPLENLPRMKKRRQGLGDADLADPEGDPSQFTGMGPQEDGVEIVQIPDRLEVKVPGSEKLKATNIPALSYKRLQFYIDLSYRQRNSPEGGAVLIYGDPGLGKSQVVKQTMQNIARSEGREFIDITDISDNKFIVANPEKYFIFADVRASQLQPYDLTGIPQIANTDKEHVETKHFPWIYLFSLEGIAGTLFLDEIGHAHPDVHNALFSVILDKKAGDLKLSKDVSIISASNLANEFDEISGSKSLPQPLVNRFNVYALVANPQEWEEYAKSYGIDKNIIHFVMLNSSELLFNKPPADEWDGGPFPTPRSIFKFDAMYKELKRHYANLLNTGQRPSYSFWDEVHTAAAGTTGYEWANKFDAHMKHYRELDWDAYIQNPKLIKKASGHAIRALTVKMGHLIDKRDPETWKQVLNVLQHGPIEHIPSILAEISTDEIYEEFSDWIIDSEDIGDPKTTLAWRNYLDPNEQPRDSKGNLDPDYGNSLMARVMKVSDVSQRAFGKKKKN